MRATIKIFEFEWDKVTASARVCQFCGVTMNEGDVAGRLRLMQGQKFRLAACEVCVHDILDDVPIVPWISTGLGIGDVFENGPGLFVLTEVTLGAVALVGLSGEHRGQMLRGVPTKVEDVRNLTAGEHYDVTNGITGMECVSQGVKGTLVLTTTEVPF